MTGTTAINPDNLVPRIHIPSGDQLGESVRYHRAGDSLHWVDIFGSAIHIARGDRKHSVKVAIQPGFVALLESGDFFAGGDQQLIQPTNGKINAVNVAECDPGSVINDGMISPDGRCLVFGSRDEKEEKPLGRMMVLTESGLIVYPHRYTVFNGPAFSACGQIIYFTDSPSGKIWQADFATATGKMGEPALFATVPANQGFPDGMCTDDEGCLWSAHWDGACLTRYRTDGSVDATVPLPVTRPTSVAFGGKSRNTLYITSAMPDDQRRRSPVDGIADGDLLSMAMPISGPTSPCLQFDPLDVIRQGVVIRIS